VLSLYSYVEKDLTKLHNVDIILDHNANHLYVRYFVSHCTPTQLHLRGYKRNMINSQGHRIGEEEAGVGLHVDTTAHFVTLPPIIGEQRIVMSVFVCLSIFMSVCEHISETTRPISADFFVHTIQYKHL